MKHYRLCTELPPRPVAPGPPALALPRLWVRCREELDARTVSAVEALIALDQPEAGTGAEPGAVEADAVTRGRARIERARQLADESGSELLRAWTAHEQALREALAARRAEVLGRPWPAAAPDVEDRATALAAMVAGAMAGSDPQQRQWTLDAARLRELERLVGIDPFDTDALLAQVVAAIVLQRWDFDDEGEALEEVWA
ncbi:hypothetical protein [Paraliomyxa miuraensis]|uniref:hypothetical protein n=1 Tax=Paraliomyxa miuraensis TaxID=376150 RepID=UPI00225445AB|nr:hypothetical protein [Paraliomyxa miuraensis]MCX4247730.1 hypothetical protein [Paraliomyxa miuraensis]